MLFHGSGKVGNLITAGNPFQLFLAVPLLPLCIFLPFYVSAPEHVS